MSALTDAALLVALARSSITGKRVDPQFPGLSEAKWDELFKAARLNGLLAMVAAGAELSGIALPTVYSEMSQRAAWFADIRSAQAWKEAGIVLDALQNAGIDVVVVKGIVLASRHYPQLSLRPFGDIDILIQPTVRENACRVLLDLGYICTDDLDVDGKAWGVDNHYHWTFARAGSIPIELHWKLGHNFPANQSEFDILWRRTQPVAGPDRAVRALDVFDELVALSVHTCTHCFRLPLRSHADFAAILNRFREGDWDELWYRAAELGRQRELAAALGVANLLGFVDLSANSLKLVENENTVDIPFLAEYAAEYRVIMAPERLLEVRNAKTKRESAVRLFRAAFPRRSHLSAPAFGKKGRGIVVYARTWSRRAVRLVGSLRNIRKFASDCKRSERVYRMLSQTHKRL